MPTIVQARRERVSMPINGGCPSSGYRKEITAAWRTKEAMRIDVESMEIGFFRVMT